MARLVQYYLENINKNLKSAVKKISNICPNLEFGVLNSIQLAKKKLPQQIKCTPYISKKEKKKEKMVDRKSVV